MSAATIAAALGDARREGRAWRCRCPLHGGRSLVLRDGDAGCVLATCWGGCNRLDVLAELRRRGLLDDRRTDYSPPSFTSPRRGGDEVERIRRALAIWRTAQRGTGSIVETYMAGRGIAFDQWPTVLRFHPHCPRPRDRGNVLPSLPAMVALVEHATHGPVAVHATYLKLDGTGKADLPKSQQRATFGRRGGGAVRFGIPRLGERLIVGEGIESTLSAALPCGLASWAALSADGIEHLILPPEAADVVIAADHDFNGTGQLAAHEAAARWLAEGRHVRIALPPEPGVDFNDLLNGRCAAKLKGGRHAA